VNWIETTKTSSLFWFGVVCSWGLISSAQLDRLRGLHSASDMLVGILVLGSASVYWFIGIYHFALLFVPRRASISDEVVGPTIGSVAVLYTTKNDFVEQGRAVMRRTALLGFSRLHFG
jgi:hypothetical protein